MSSAIEFVKKYRPTIKVGSAMKDDPKTWRKRWKFELSVDLEVMLSVFKFINAREPKDKNELYEFGIALFSQGLADIYNQAINKTTE